MGLSAEEYLAEVLRRAAHRYNVISIVYGIATNITDDTCDVEREGETILLGVRLHAVDNALDNCIVIKPTDGSVVICGIIENDKAEACILQCGEIDEVLIKIGTVVHRINTDGYLIQKGENTLKDVLTGFIDGLNALKQAVTVINIQGQVDPDPSQLAIATDKITNATTMLNDLLQ